MPVPGEYEFEWNDGSTTTYYGVTNFSEDDTGRVTFTGRKGSPTADLKDYVVNSTSYRTYSTPV